MVGQPPPANVIFRLCLPRVAFSVESSILAAGSFCLASGSSKFDQAFQSAGSSKSDKTTSLAASFVSEAGTADAAENAEGQPTPSRGSFDEIRLISQEAI